MHSIVREKQTERKKGRQRDRKRENGGRERQKEIERQGSSVGGREREEREIRKLVVSGGGVSSRFNIMEF